LKLKELHIICLNVPYPVDFGANFEQFYKIKALYEAGVAIHLHCFLYKDNIEQPILLNYCKTVHYYQRSSIVSFRLPFIVYSRKNEDLLQNLLKDKFPILMDGIHSSYLVLDKRFKNRKLLVRTLNVEYLYYKGLATATPFSLKKMYYLWEAYRLKNYERKIAAKASLITISSFDRDYFTNTYKAVQNTYIPVFFESVFSIPTGYGNYCIYHGNLSVSENEEAALWLINHVFKTLSITLVIAGKNPDKRLIEMAAPYNHIHIISNPDKEEMDNLIADAHINVLPAINSTGIKLKIISALYQSRFCVTNSIGAMGITDKNMLVIEDDAHKMRNTVITLMQTEFTAKQKEQRIKALQTTFSTAANAPALIKLIYD
jgi:transcription antitermination factor NusA-like protein